MSSATNVVLRHTQMSSTLHSLSQIGRDKLFFAIIGHLLHERTQSFEFNKMMGCLTTLKLANSIKKTCVRHFPTHPSNDHPLCAWGGITTPHTLWTYCGLQKYHQTSYALITTPCPQPCNIEPLCAQNCGRSIIIKGDYLKRLEQ